MNKIPLIILFSLLCTAGFAQLSNLKWESKTYDHGTVEEWNNPPAVFRFKNTSDHEVLFLKQFYQRDIFVRLPEKPVPPGATGEIAIYYYTDETGSFSRKVQLYIKSDYDPLELKVKGKIKSIYENALTACPRFGPKTTPQKDEDRKTLGDMVLIDRQEEETETQERQRQEEVEEEETIAMESNVNDQWEDQQEETVVVESNLNEQYEEGQVTEKNEEVTDFQAEIEQEIQQTEQQEEAEEDEETLSRELYGSNNIVFLVDVSGSMRRDDKMDMLQSSMKRLAVVLRDIDQVTLIKYSSDSEVILPTTKADEKNTILSLIDSLEPGGLTRGVRGMQTAYELADRKFIDGGNNQVILATDGKFNSSSYSEGDVLDLVKKYADKDIKLSVVGFGQSRTAIRMLKRMARQGNGNFMQILPEQTDLDLLINEIKANSLKQ